VRWIERSQEEEMISEEAILTQNKIIGVLLRQARIDANKSVQACAKALGYSPEFIDRAEEGREALSLPQLESLGHILGVPVSYFLETEMLPEDDVDQQLPYDDAMLIRRRIIGVILRQARQEAGRTLDELASRLGYKPEYLGRAELGEMQIPVVTLQAWADELGLPFEVFTTEDVIPVTSEEQSQRDVQLLRHLPSEIRDFILKPINLPYLHVAMNLSQMPAETLRQIASGLLEITY
jgi:transcriptional regulator with XRE-family HTH domain